MSRTSTRDLTDTQWETLDKLIPERHAAKTDADGLGRAGVRS